MVKFCNYINSDDLFTYAGYGIELIHKYIVYNRPTFLYKKGNFMLHVLGGDEEYKCSVIKYFISQN